MPPVVERFIECARAVVKPLAVGPKVWRVSSHLEKCPHFANSCPRLRAAGTEAMEA
jgi:hypothetical protein